MLKATTILTLVLCPLATVAQERLDENEIFGQPAPQQDPTQSPPGPLPTPTSEGKTYGELPQTQQAPEARLLPPPFVQDPLKIGGQIYLRTVGQWQQGVRASDSSLSAPALVDGYMDVRPNDRVRGFLLTRLQYDLSRSTSQTATDASAGSSGGVGGSSATDLLGTSQNPQLLLDQLWVTFDVEHAAFVTAGKQHVKWGTGVFWNPTDFLHPVRRDPLAVFDTRTGETMVKLHLPWERRGWNLFAMAVADESQPVGHLGHVGAGARAEVVFGTAELGIDGLVRRGKDALLGLDFSAGFGDFDLHGEAELRKGSDLALFRPEGTAGALTVGAPYQPDGLRPAIVGGLSWSYKYSDQDSLTAGFEYFYDSNGYEDASLYPWLLVQQQQTGLQYFTPFYLGRRYAALYLRLPKPGSWNDTTFSLSTLGNLGDRSYVTRLDCSVLLLTYLTLEAYVAGHYGARGGEFRFALDVPQTTLPSSSGAAKTVGPLSSAAPVLDFGLAVRLKL